MGFQIAIDGPAGAGKSTIAKRVAAALGYLYIDTGAMYRALGLSYLEQGIAPEDAQAVRAGLDAIRLDLDMCDGVQHVLLNEEDVTGRIRTEEVGMAASRISTYKEVRQKLVALQQKIAGQKDVVMDGRDIGTVVLPDAPLKIFLTASVRTRALRRKKDLEAAGEAADLATIERDIEERDEQDRTRKESPLRQAADAVLIDSSEMTIEEVTEKILALQKEKEGTGR